MANVLFDLGLTSGDTVGLYLPNSPQFLIAYYGILRAGMIAVPINPMLTGEDLAFIIKDAQLKAVIGPVEAVTTLEQAKTADLQIISTALTGQLDPASNPPTPGVLALEALLWRTLPAWFQKSASTRTPSLISSIQGVQPAGPRVRS